MLFFQLHAQHVLSIAFSVLGLEPTPGGISILGSTNELSIAHVLVVGNVSLVYDNYCLLHPFEPCRFSFFMNA